MANYYGSCRTNYVKLKEGKLEEFKEFFSKINQCVVYQNDAQDKVCVVDEENDIPFSVYDDEEGDYNETDWKKVADMLEDGEVLHWVGVGQEKMRYMEGCALFVMSNGEVEVININEPPPKVAQFIKDHNKQHNKPCY